MSFVAPPSLPSLSLSHTRTTRLCISRFLPVCVWDQSQLEEMLQQQHHYEQQQQHQQVAQARQQGHCLFIAPQHSSPITMEARTKDFGGKLEEGGSIRRSNNSSNSDRVKDVQTERLWRCVLYLFNTCLVLALRLFGTYFVLVW